MTVWTCEHSIKPKSLQVRTRNIRETVARAWQQQTSPAALKLQDKILTRGCLSFRSFLASLHVISLGLFRSGYFALGSWRIRVQLDPRVFMKRGTGFTRTSKTARFPNLVLTSTVLYLLNKPMAQRLWAPRSAVYRLIMVEKILSAAVRVFPPQVFAPGVLLRDQVRHPSQSPV